MQRRKFVRDSGILVTGIGVFGNIKWNGSKFIGDTPTTTDILGPFYRPGAPFRKNLNPPGFAGSILDLSGTILKDDGKTPPKTCLVEIWQNLQNGLYDNISDDFLYRASQKTSRNGRYHFITTLPVPEPVPERENIFRPSHIHLRISSEGQQDLITQIYFLGDPYLASDPSTRSGLAINRILKVKKVDETKNAVQFDIVLSKEYLPDDNVFRQVSGIYKMNDGSMMEFYRNGDMLFYKTNGQIWGGLSYVGNNSFGGTENDTEARFQLLSRGEAKVWFRFSRRRETKLEGIKQLSYQGK
jgi:protocatechuate 3,4-dioxygenase beta subunit